MRLSLSWLTILTLGLTLSAEGGESISRGDVYPASGGSAPVFMNEKGMKETPHGHVYTERYADRNGNPLTMIEAHYERGRLTFLKFDQYQLEEVSTAEVKDGKVVYSHTSQGKTKHTTDKDPGDFVAAPAIPYAILASWNDLQNGKALEFTIPIPARRQSFHVKVTKIRTFSRNGQALSEFKMEPTNPIFRTLADPMYFVFDEDEKTLMEFRGATVAKTGTPGNWKDFTGRIVYRP